MPGRMQPNTARSQRNGTIKFQSRNDSSGCKGLGSPVDHELLRVLIETTIEHNPNQGMQGYPCRVTSSLFWNLMVLPRNGRRWLEELVKGANCWDMHGIQPTLELPRGTINASVHLRPCVLHRKEGVSEPARSWPHRKISTISRPAASRPHIGRSKFTNLPHVFRTNS